MAWLFTNVDIIFSSEKWSWIGWSLLFLLHADILCFYDLIIVTLNFYKFYNTYIIILQYIFCNIFNIKYKLIFNIFKHFLIISRIIKWRSMNHTSVRHFNYIENCCECVSLCVCVYVYTYVFMYQQLWTPLTANGGVYSCPQAPVWICDLLYLFIPLLLPPLPYYHFI